MSRIAKSSPVMWANIFKQNKTNLLNSINLYEKQIIYIKKMLQDEQYDKIEQWMNKANSLHDIL
jgi:prephenate dehydrogenase